MKKKDTRLFVQLFHDLLDTPAWRALSPGAKCLYVSLRRRYDKGKPNIRKPNNGHVFVSCRQAAREIGISKSKAAHLFAELGHYGFIVMTSPGCLGLDGKGKAPHWRLTELDTAEEKATMDYLNWDGALVENPPSRRRAKKQNPVHTSGHPVHTAGHTADEGVHTSGHRACPPIWTYLEGALHEAPPQERTEREDEGVALSPERGEAAAAAEVVETVNGERRVATAAMTELPVPFAFGVLRRRRNRLLSTTMPTPRHATGGEFPKMIMAGELWAHCTPSRRGKAEPHRSLTVTVQKARALPGLGHTTMWKLISTGVLETRKIGR